MGSTPLIAGRIGRTDLAWSGRVGDLLRATGQRRFEPDLLRFLNDLCGAEHVHIFLFDEDRPRVLTSLSLDGSQSAAGQTQAYMAGNLWRVDAAMGAGSKVVGEGPELFRLDTREAHTSELRDFYSRRQLRERIMLCGREEFGSIGLSMMRSDDRGLLAGNDHAALVFAADLVFPVVAQHVDACGRSQRLIEALTSLPLIERTLATSSRPFPPRERQVASRLLYGLSASSIAVDLGIGDETVLTHRKRLYQRLGITSHRELLLWYVGLYGGLPDDEAPAVLPF